MNTKDFISPQNLKKYDKSDVTFGSTGGMTRFKPNIDLDKLKNCIITDPKQEITYVDTNNNE